MLSQLPLVLKPLPIAVPKECVPDGFDLGGKRPMVLGYIAEYDGRVYYCVEANGRLKEGLPSNKSSADDLCSRLELTVRGAIAVGAFSDFVLQLGTVEGVSFERLQGGPSPVRTSLRRIFSEYPSGAAIALVGDFAGDLNGEMEKLVKEGVVDTL